MGVGKCQPLKVPESTPKTITCWAKLLVSQACPGQACPFQQVGDARTEEMETATLETSNCQPFDNLSAIRTDLSHGAGMPLDPFTSGSKIIK